MVKKILLGLGLCGLVSLSYIHLANRTNVNYLPERLEVNRITRTLESQRFSFDGVWCSLYLFKWKSLGGRDTVYDLGCDGTIDKIHIDDGGALDPFDETVIRGEDMKSFTHADKVYALELADLRKYVNIEEEMQNWRFRKGINKL